MDRTRHLMIGLTFEMFPRIHPSLGHPVVKLVLIGLLIWLVATLCARAGHGDSGG